MAGNSPVVVGVDGSKDGLIALAWAAEHAARWRLPLRAVHVVDESRYPAPADEDVYGETVDEVRRLGYDGEMTVETRLGSPARTLLELSHRTELLVVGRRGMDGFAELMVGSVSQACAALAVTPVVVVPDYWHPEAPRWGRVVVGVDGSADCRPAVEYAFQMASMSDAELFAVHAVEVLPDFPGNDLWTDPGQPPPWTGNAERLLAESLAEPARKHPDVAVRSRAVAGHPVQVLASESGMADLVVVGGYGRSRFTELRMGSVSRGLLHHIRCPVAIIHSGRRP